MEIYQGIVLGILQGLTEFLPVSSSGHLILGQRLFGITEAALFFDVSVHMGTLGAVFLVFFQDIKHMLLSLAGLFREKSAGKPFAARVREDESSWLAVLIAVGSVPTAIIGLVLKQFEQVLFSSIVIVGAMLLLTGTILWFSRLLYSKTGVFTSLGMKQALFIGVVQGLAVIPGISRSGSTIAAGLFAGLDGRHAARFSFLLSIPAILGAQVLSINDALKEGFRYDPAALYGALAAFLSGYVALIVLLKIVKKGRFHFFAPYCWALGGIALFSAIL